MYGKRYLISFIVLAYQFLLDHTILILNLIEVVMKKSVCSNTVLS